MAGSSPATTGTAAMIEYLDGQGVEYELVEHEPTMSAVAEAHATHWPEAQVAKTVVLQNDTGYILAIIPASKRVDLKRVREYLGAIHSVVVLASEQDIARDFPTLEVGATPPIGPMLPRAELIDVRLMEKERILCAGGDHRHSFLLNPRDIVRIADASVVDICEG